MANTNPQRLAGWASRWLTDELQALASVGNWEAAIQTFQQMGDVTREEPVPGTQNIIASSALSSSLSASSSSSSPTTTSTSPSYHQKQAQNARIFHYTTIISACAKADQWEAALRAFTHMHREAKCEPNVKTYTSVIHACTKGDRLDLALRAWGMMEADGVVANCFTTTALVAAFAKAGKWQEAIAATLEAEKNPFPNQEPNVFTYTAAMDACRRAQQAQAALGMLKRMTRVRGIVANTVSYTTALNACATSKDWKAALEVLDMMKEDKIFIVPFARSCALQVLAEAPPEIADKGLDPWLGQRKDKINTFSEKKAGFGEAKTVTVKTNSNSAAGDEEEQTSAAISDSTASADLLQDPPTPASYKEQKQW